MAEWSEERGCEPGNAGKEQDKPDQIKCLKNKNKFLNDGSFLKMFKKEMEEKEEKTNEIDIQNKSCQSETSSGSSYRLKAKSLPLVSGGRPHTFSP